MPADLPAPETAAGDPQRRLDWLVAEIRALHFPDPTRLNGGTTLCYECADTYPCPTVDLLPPA